MVRRQGTTALCDDIGMRYIILIGSLCKRINTVVHILLNAVVHTALAVTTSGTVIVDTQTTATVYKFYIEAHLMQLHIILGHLAKGGADTTNLVYLATDMEVNQLQAVTQAHLIQHLQRH